MAPLDRFYRYCPEFRSLSESEKFDFIHFRHVDKQEGQVALNLSVEFCLKFTYRYLLKAQTMSLVTPGAGPFLAPGA